MYQFLLKFVPPKLANALIIIWYMALLIGIACCLDQAQGNFRYLDY